MLFLCGLYEQITSHSTFRKFTSVPRNSMSDAIYDWSVELILDVFPVFFRNFSSLKFFPGFFKNTVASNRNNLTRKCNSILL